MALLILTMGIDLAGVRRDSTQLCTVLTSTLQNCQPLKDRCLRNYHVAVTEALATIKANPSDAFQDVARLDELDELYADGKRISERIQSGALDRDGAFNATKEILEGCRLIYAGIEF